MLFWNFFIYSLREHYLRRWILLNTPLRLLLYQRRSDTTNSVTFVTHTTRFHFPKNWWNEGTVKTLLLLTVFCLVYLYVFEYVYHIYLWMFCPLLDDQWLIAFLRGCKFSLERTKEKLDLYYAIRKTAPDLYRIHHKDPLFNEILELG